MTTNEFETMIDLLKRGVEQGYWTLEQLDYPSSGWSMNDQNWRKHPDNREKAHRVHRNLLRDEADTDIY